MQRVLPVLFAVSAFALAACGSSSSSTTGTSATSAAAPAGGATAPAAAAQSGLVPVKYQNIAISPANITVKVGSTVKWTNFDQVNHNVTVSSGPVTFHSSDFGAGGTFSMKLTKPGTYHYLCTIHPSAMIGSITVVP
jgi:plastocyanin